MRKDSHSTDDVTKGVDVLEVGTVQSATSDSGLSSLGSSMTGPRGRAYTRLTPTSMRKTLSVGMTNIVGKLKNRLDPDDIDEDR